MVKLKLLFLLLILCSLNFGQEISVKASVDSVDYQVGDYINYKITIRHSENVTVLRPTLDSLKMVEVIKIEPVKREDKDGNITTVFEYTISKYDSGDVTIPSIAVIYNIKNAKEAQVIKTNMVNFTVHTLKVDPHGDVKDIKEPIKIPLDWKIILFWILAGLLVLALIVWAVSYYRKKKALKAGGIITIRREPHEEAFDELNELEAKKLWQNGYIKQYHTEITAVIRKYFEGRFRIPALEMTTSELLYQLNRVPDASEITEVTNAFLYNADLVKFAKFVPMNNINEEMLRQAYLIVEKTVPVIVEEDQQNV